MSVWFLDSELSTCFIVNISSKLCMDPQHAKSYQNASVIALIKAQPHGNSVVQSVFEWTLLCIRVNVPPKVTHA